MNEIIGLVGKPGAGKSYISRLMAKHLGFSVVNVDLIGRIALSENGAEVARLFGDVMKGGGVVDRKKLADIVFSDDEAMKKLNALIHPLLPKYIRGSMNEHGRRVIDAALLFEAKLDNMCDAIWFVDAPFEVRLSRVKKRDWDADKLNSVDRHFFLMKSFLASHL
jgi:dephospho-CoA kinase